MIRIEHAFCVQLNRLVTIDEARGAFGAQQDLERFDFCCAEPACVAHGIRIAGVNYRIDAATGRKFVENHFRRWDAHRPDCPYADGDRRVEEHVSAAGGAHRTHALVADGVTIFDPPLDDVTGDVHAVPEPVGRGSLTHRADRPLHARERPARLARPLRTSSLARLVDTYRQAREQMTAQELAAYRIAVSGVGRMPLVRYVLPVAAAHEGPPCRVYYGGARLLRYYGCGFKLRFYDRYRDKPVYLYVTSDAVRSAAEAAVLLERLDAMERGEYSTVYVLGRLDASIDGSTYSVAVTDLRRLAWYAPRSNGTLEPRERSSVGW